MSESTATVCAAPLVASVCAPTRFNVPPVRVGVPSLNVTLVADCVPLIVIVYAPVASLPAEKIALALGVQACPATSPLALLLQLVVAPQVPLGVAPPDPGVALSISQYKVGVEI